MMGTTKVRSLCAPILLGLALCALSVAPATAQTPKQVSQEEFAALSWLEGRWVGSGGGIDAFYESYRFANDGRIEQTTWTDSSFTTADGRSTIDHQGGFVTKARDGRVEYVVTDLDAEEIRFDAAERGGTGFRWTRISNDEWVAVLDRKGEAPVVYNMRRLAEGG